MATTTITYVKHSPVLSNATLLSTRFHYVTLIHDIWDVFWGQQNSHDSLFEATEREKQFCQQLLYLILYSQWPYVGDFAQKGPFFAVFDVFAVKKNKWKIRDMSSSAENICRLQFSWTPPN